MAFNVNYSFNNGEITGTATNITDLKNAINSSYTQCTLSGVAEGSLSGLFAYKYSIKTIDLSNLDTSGVTDMSQMFNTCAVLTDLNISNLNTSNVTNMAQMFYQCMALTSIDVSNFDTSNVTDMNYMFSYIRNITSLNLLNFNTSNVTNMSAMFYGNNALTNIDISSFDTSKVTKMNSMFSGFGGEQLDLSSFNTARVDNMQYMFSACPNLKHIYVSDNFITSNVTNSSGMFASCEQLPNFDSNITDKTKAYIGEGGYLEFFVEHFFVFQQHINRNNKIVNSYPKIKLDEQSLIYKNNLISVKNEIKILTEEEYNDISDLNPTTLYIIIDDDE